MTKSFRIRQDLRSFHLDTHPYPIHALKESLRSFFLRRFGLGDEVLVQIHYLISERDFNEPHELFDNLRAFFLSKYPAINLSIYRYRHTDKSLEFYLGDAYSHTKKIHLRTVSEKDYLNEKRTVKNYQFSGEISWVNFWGKAAIRINDFVLSFGERGASFEKNIRDLRTLFSVWLSNLIRAKLAVIEEKYTDQRTGLYNSKYLQEVAAKKPFSIVKIDINDFKSINDNHGHIEGDRVLEELGKILKESVRTDDKACRDGGDEFVLLIDSSEMISIERIIHRIEESLESLNQKRNFPIHIALWFCLYDENIDFKERLRIADERMYTQKNERSYIYRLAKKIALIKDPDNLKELLSQIHSSLPKGNISSHK